MVDIGWLELLVIFIVVLVVLGPTRLPEVARTFGLWLGRLRRMYSNFRLELDREVGMDDVRRQLHNEQIMSEMQALEQESKSILSDVNAPLSVNKDSKTASSSETDDKSPAKSPPNAERSVTEGG